MEDMFDVSGDVPTFDDDDSMFGFGSTQMRSRAYTWPSRPPDSTLLGERPNFSPGDATEVSPDVMQTNDGNQSSGDAPLSPDGANANRKTSSRRNAWGSMSYADLITRAIESSPEKRLTLSQIYAWMVANVPFFHDKGDSNSSAGWKNSIRHNLSLHSRFMRVQNEGTGKSSWWMVNTEAPSSKMPRKRAGTMDATSGYRRPTKPGKRLPGVLKHARSTELHGAGNGSVCEDLPDSGLPTLGTSVDPIRFGSPRMRASSGNSSNSGCSPAALGTPQEPDSSGACFGIPPAWDVFPKHETLSESLADIFISDVDNGIASQTQAPPPMYSPMLQQQQPQPAFMSADAYARGLHTTPPQFVTTTGQQQPPILIQQPQQQQDPSSYNQFNATSAGSSFPIIAGIAPTDHIPTLGELLQDQRPGSGYHLHSYLTSGGSMSTQLPGGAAVNWQSPGVSETAAGLRAPELQSPQLSQSSPDATPLRRPFQINQRLLMQLLATKPHLATRLQQLIEAKRRQLTSVQQMPMTSQLPHQPGIPPGGRPAGAPTMLQQLLTASSPSSAALPQQQAAPPQQSSVNAAQQSQPRAFDGGGCISDDLFPSDLDLTLLDQISTADINCDIDQVIQHELAFGDKLDFSFDQLHLEEFGADFTN